MAELVALWLVTWWFHSTLLYGGAWLAERLRLLRAPAAREQMWRTVMLGALFTSTLQWTGMVKPVTHAWLSSVGAAQEHDSSRMTETELAAARMPHADVHISTATNGLMPSAPPIRAVASADSSALERLRALLTEHWSTALSLLWLVGAGLALLRLVVLGRLARHELVDREPATGAVATEFARLCAALRVRRPPLSIAPVLAGPVSLPSGEIVVPPWAVAGLDARRQKALLAHELAHLVRRDPQWQACTLGLQALLWLQPLQTLVRNRLAVLAELQADAWAARAIGDPRALAECLAECAERLTESRVALFGSALTYRSLLVERVDRLLAGISVRTQAPFTVHVGLLVSMVGAAFVLPGCDAHHGRWRGPGASMTVSVSGDGDTHVTSARPDYSLVLDADGSTVFNDDEADVAALAPGGKFTLIETFAGIEREFVVTADRHGTLTRRLRRDDVGVPLDADGERWLAEALLRMFRESGFAAPERVARLLSKGGPARVLSEIDLATNDHSKSALLGELLAAAELDSEQAALVLASTAEISSSAELRTALSRALTRVPLGVSQCTLLLGLAARMRSDSELAEFLIEVAGRLPDGARDAWVAAATQIESDCELGRTLAAAFASSESDASFDVLLLQCAARMRSDSELADLLSAVVSTLPAGAHAAWISVARGIESDHELGRALTAASARHDEDSSFDAELHALAARSRGE